MLSFVVGTAVRTAARAAVHHHYQQAAAARAAALAGPLALHPIGDGETALFEDRRVGFTHALPGYPRPLPLPTADPLEPAADAIVGLAELPVGVRYRLDRPAIAAASAGEYAAKAAHAYAQNRAQAAVDVRPPEAAQLVLWRVEAAAMASYRLRQPDAYGADSEDLLVLVRDGSALAVTFRYPSSGIDWLRLALVKAATRSNLCWGGRTSTTIWPVSDFLERGLFGALTPHRAHLAAQLAPLLTMPSEEREKLSSLLGRVVARPEPPWFVLTPQLVAEHVNLLSRASSSGPLAQVVHQGMAEVRTMHDLRGFAILIGQAISTNSGPGQ